MADDPKAWEGHTPGPWEVNGVHVHSDTNGATNIAQAYRTYRPDNSLANAALIAAAPSLAAENAALRARLAEAERERDSYRETANALAERTAEAERERDEAREALKPFLRLRFVWVAKWRHYILPEHFEAASRAIVEPPR